ncbi:nuclear transport factor 2 family protein [Rhodohalobacter mucosus]|uniref:Nuclear transport factor 2 family protein n=1 Tax=Rhodohalobacter mucosus TaxID=2079485 RepID=A0A316TYR1_9BACT|nr:nuclear transport factor 2 family protein [Rhodohalobacter mucosus]PWN07964.1 nuclear transport factor 2 family protein [Rhodohalobacter mucosus]
MKRLTPVLLLLLCACISVPALVIAQSNDNEDEKELLSTLLYDFLEGASYDDPATHNRFWAEDLIYTGSNGTRNGKAVIMNGLSGTPDRSVEPETEYDADQVQINVYDDMAVVAFRLIARFNTPGEEGTRYYYNTGTFQKRNGEWKAVAWQATVIPQVN